MLHSLEDYGILIGVGSACSSKKGINKFQSRFVNPFPARHRE